MAPKYDFATIETKWRGRWAEARLDRTPEPPKRKYYVLEMFAYPSGDIHMGHFRNYSIGDVVARYRKMQGFDVLHPFGWDAFGQPAEGAAIKHGNLHPREWTIGNVETGKKTLQRMGLSYDWDREIRTCEPDYYKWTQWVFLQLHQAGLAYRGPSWVNWCSTCDTSLTNEQSEGGVCWRCGNAVSMKELQGCWFFRTSQFAERLLRDIDKLDGWPEPVRTIQRNWIGRSEGAEIDFELDPLFSGDASAVNDVVVKLRAKGYSPARRPPEKIKVFTTRPDTIYGVTFMAVSPESPLARSLPVDPARKREVEEYIQKALVRDEAQREKEKDGVFTGRYAVNPFNGERAQLWVADYVLGGYGTGVVMGVPAHDQRDFEFAKKYGIPIRVVIQPEGETLDPARMTGAFVDDGVMVHSGPFDGTPNRDGIRRTTEHAASKGFGRSKVQYKLRDWLVSRQRYWGCPIPIVHCAKCGSVPVPEKNLPVLLPLDIKNFIPKGRSPLADSPAYLKTSCPTCGGAAERDPDTMDTFMCSSWYQNRYVDPKNDRAPWDKEEARKWLPIDLYIGGIEHARGHCLYFRFITKVLFDRGWLPVDEPAVRLFNHGMVCDEKGDIMSKSKGNVVSPADVFDRYGVDVARLAMFFFAPSEDQIKWSERGLVGAQRFVHRLWDLMGELAPRVRDVTEKPSGTGALRRKLHQTLQKMTSACETDLHFNTAIAAVMELLNVWDKEGASVPVALQREFAVGLTMILAPLAPFLAEEFHEWLGGTDSVFRSRWPEADSAVAAEESVEVPVQVNGKLRGRFTVPVGASEEDYRARALADEAVRKALDGKTPRKVIVVKGKLVNIVV